MRRDITRLARSFAISRADGCDEGDIERVKFESMISTPGLLASIEKAAVRGWPARTNVDIDGWLARSTSGGSVRANSVAALDYRGADVERSIDEVIAFYRARKAEVRFTVSDASEPAGLDEALARRGFRRSADHVTLAKAVTVGPEVRSDIRVVQADAPTPEWYSVYLQGLSDSRRAQAPSIVERVPAPRVFFTALRDGVAIGSGLSVIDGELASIQCMATLAAVRRTGAATAVLCAIEGAAHQHGVRWLYLQTETANHAAVGAYTRYGFKVAGRYHTRDL